MPLIVFASPKGGVGKSTLAAHVAVGLSARGHHVLALDTDPQNALRLHLQLPLQYEAGFLAGLGKGTSWRSAVVATPTGVQLLPFGSTTPMEALALGATLLREPDLLSDPVRNMLEDPKLVLLVDSAPGPSAAVSAIAKLVDLTITVLLADGASASLIPQVVASRRGTLAAVVGDRSAIVLNQVDIDSPLSNAVMSNQALRSRLLGAVCRDDAVAEAFADGRLLDAGGGAADDIALLVDAVAERLQLRPTGGTRGGFSALARWNAS